LSNGNSEFVLISKKEEIVNLKREFSILKINWTLTGYHAKNRAKNSKRAFRYGILLPK
jgi:hypothetical protein